MAYNIQDLLAEMVKRGASDLHITAGAPPLIRLSGKLTPIGENKLKPDETMRMTYSLMNELQKASQPVLAAKGMRLFIRYCKSCAFPCERLPAAWLRGACAPYYSA